MKSQIFISSLLLWTAGASVAQPPIDGWQLPPNRSTSRIQPSRNPECQVEDEDTIVVCGKTDRNERYRLPLRQQPWTPSSQMDSVGRERHRLLDHGDAGIHSCSTSGPGGSTGCTFKAWKNQRLQNNKE